MVHCVFILGFMFIFFVILEGCVLFKLQEQVGKFVWKCLSLPFYYILRSSFQSKVDKSGKFMHISSENFPIFAMTLECNMCNLSDDCQGVGKSKMHMASPCLAYSTSYQILTSLTFLWRYPYPWKTYSSRSITICSSSSHACPSSENLSFFWRAFQHSDFPFRKKMTHGHARWMYESL